MANENEQVKKNEEDKEETKPEHHENLIERAIDHINDEFPLSGGETNNDIIFWEEKEKTPEEIEAKTKALDEDLNKKYPLSGGETDEDLDV